MTKGTISLEDARIVHDFAHNIEYALPASYTKLKEAARTVQRISYLSMADARQKARAERARHADFDDYPTEVLE